MDQKIPDAQQIGAVLRKSALILSDPKLEITQNVTDELNKTLSSVKVKVTP